MTTTTIRGRMAPLFPRVLLLAGLTGVLTAGCGTPAVCDDLGDIPTDCALDDEGDPLRQVCQVALDDRFPTTEITCGRSEAKYLAQICGDDPSIVTEEVADAIECFDEEPDTGA